MTLFDRYIVVDWSANASPKTGRDSLWIADLPRGGDVSLHNPSTRTDATALLSSVIATCADERVLIGVDASLGYPAGSARLLGLDGRPWRATWRAVSDLLVDDDRNGNNRFAVAAALNRRARVPEGPFWGCPSDDHAPDLRRTKPPSFPVPEFRLVERLLRQRGQYPKSSWQLLGVGSVGSQTLTLLPALTMLLDRVEIWPFTTGLRTPVGGVVVAEVWPRMFVTEIADGAVADAEQVAGTAAALAAADRHNSLEAWFNVSIDDPHGVVETEEGWILGVEMPRGG